MCCIYVTCADVLLTVDAKKTQSLDLVGGGVRGRHPHSLDTAFKRKMCVRPLVLVTQMLPRRRMIPRGLRKGYDDDDATKTTDCILIIDFIVLTG